ncbi:hypothetical protein BDA99DRAFT_534377 [Phascolomyces articulosus]|uniref:Uncharacterized protein n=1 Tax=Phascolomyces articulosus TaxID=60185 RepID=A0AAD5KIP4_9FUNG|nr:hypothetical protein BDA99DRAFT_534377 [Phascolomyces articulosus]
MGSYPSHFDYYTSYYDSPSIYSRNRRVHWDVYHQQQQQANNNWFNNQIYLNQQQQQLQQQQQQLQQQQLHQQQLQHQEHQQRHYSGLFSVSSPPAAPIAPQSPYFGTMNGGGQYMHPSSFGYFTAINMIRKHKMAEEKKRSVPFFMNVVVVGEEPVPFGS